jgi:hypothetical protein
MPRYYVAICIVGSLPNCVQLAQLEEEQIDRALVLKNQRKICATISSKQEIAIGMPQQINSEETNSLVIQFVAFNSKAHTSYEYFNTTNFYVQHPRKNICLCISVCETSIGLLIDDPLGLLNKETQQSPFLGRL